MTTSPPIDLESKDLNFDENRDANKSIMKKVANGAVVLQGWLKKKNEFYMK
jgi:hypothetical protein